MLRRVPSPRTLSHNKGPPFPPYMVFFLAAGFRVRQAFSFCISKVSAASSIFLFHGDASLDLKGLFYDAAPP